MKLFSGALLIQCQYLGLGSTGRRGYYCMIDYRAICRQHAPKTCINHEQMELNLVWLLVVMPRSCTHAEEASQPAETALC